MQRETKICAWKNSSQAALQSRRNLLLGASHVKIFQLAQVHVQTARTSKSCMNVTKARIISVEEESEIQGSTPDPTEDAARFLSQIPQQLPFGRDVEEDQFSE
jgi:hypothetical protein